MVRVDNQCKVAGAAQKRTRQGLLMQGSVNDPLLQGETRNTLRTAFIRTLALHLNADTVSAADPIDHPSRFEELRAHFASPTWTTRR